MKVFFKESFLKDFKRLPEEIRDEVRIVCLSVFLKIKDLREFQTYPLKKLRGFKNYYRIKIKGFRVGFKKTNGYESFAPERYL